MLAGWRQVLTDLQHQQSLHVYQNSIFNGLTSVKRLTKQQILALNLFVILVLCLLRMNFSKV